MWKILLLAFLLLVTTGAALANTQECPSYTQITSGDFANDMAKARPEKRYLHLSDGVWEVRCVAFTDRLDLSNRTLAKSWKFDNVVFCRGLWAEGLHVDGDLRFQAVSVGHAGDEKIPNGPCADVTGMPESRRSQGLACSVGDDCYITPAGLDPGIEPIPVAFHELFKLDGFGSPGELVLAGARIDGDLVITSSQIDTLAMERVQVAKAIILEYSHLGLVQQVGVKAKAVLSTASRVNVLNASSVETEEAFIVVDGSVVGNLDLSQAVIGSDIYVAGSTIGLGKFQAAKVGRQILMGGNKDNPLPILRLIMAGMKAEAMIISHIRSLCTVDGRDLQIGGQAMLTDSQLWDGLTLTDSHFDSSLALERLGSGISDFRIPKLKAADKYLCPALAEDWAAMDLGHGHNSLRAERLEVRVDLRLLGSNFRDVHLRAATILRDLDLRGARTDKGRLLDTNVGGVLDDKGFWGGLRSGDLRGFQVKRYSLPSGDDTEPKEITDRNFERRGAAWWASQLRQRASAVCGAPPDGDFFIGSYMMIADHMQAAGMEDEADGLRWEGRYQELWHMEMSLKKVLALLSWAMVGFGYAPQLILVWFLGAFLLAMAISTSALKSQPTMAARPLMSTAGLLLARLSPLFAADKAFEQPEILPPRVRVAVIILRLTALAVVIALGSELSGVLTRAT